MFALQVISTWRYICFESYRPNVQYDDYLQGVGETEDELEGESRLINRQEPEDPGQPHEGGDPDGILEAFGDLLGAGCLLDLQETAHDQDEGDDVVEEDETDGDKEAEVQHKIGLQEATADA